jgi:energy-coupling factor transport system ATP-binding protein
LVVEDLSFRYRDREQPSISSISFTLDAGQILLVAGSSGCGKTTLARCINGLIPRSYKGEVSGRILLRGQDVAGWPLARISQTVGTVLQDPERQILGTRVLNEVAFGLENLSLAREEILERVGLAMEHLGIGALRDRETHNLSGGEKQKVALAGVLAMRPSLLILDEPLASLDPASAQEALTLVRRLADEGMAVLMIEHRVEDVLRIRPDGVLFMAEGRVRYQGAAQGLQAAVDYREVKLPAEMVIARASADPPEPHPRPAVIHAHDESEAPLVRFEGVRFAYEGTTTVLKDVNLEIRRGEGSRCSDPTVRARHAGQARHWLPWPSAGRVLVDGRDTRELSVAQVASTLGYVFQSPSHMLFAPTVREELAFGPANLGHTPDRIQKEVQEALSIVNLTGLEADPPLALSFGQQKRVSIAAILAMRSRILVMDEPTAGQDYRNYMGFMDSILSDARLEAVLFITHDVDLAVVCAAGCCW